MARHRQRRELRIVCLILRVGGRLASMLMARRIRLLRKYAVTHTPQCSNAANSAIKAKTNQTRIRSLRRRRFRERRVRVDKHRGKAARVPISIRTSPTYHKQSRRWWPILKNSRRTFLGRRMFIGKPSTSTTSSQSAARNCVKTATTRRLCLSEHPVILRRANSSNQSTIATI